MAWQWEIKPETSWLDINFKELWSYRHLLLRLIRRDFLTLYQQTLLGPLWVVIQPLMTVFMYVLIFDRVVGIPINNVPPLLFYLAGIVVWNLFAETFGSTAFTFTSNATLFSKVYFPRLVVPLSVCASHVIRFLIQFLLFLLFFLYHLFKGTIQPEVVEILIVFPFTILITSFMALGFGLGFAVFIAKYRDVGNLLNLAIRLLLFATPILYPFSFVPPELQKIMLLNPLVPVVELFRHAFLGYGAVSPEQIAYAIISTVVVFLGGTILFNKMGAKLIDVV
jgi:lipopolysaccharide transport system permease protein